MGSCTQASCSRRSPPPAATRRLRSCQPEVLTVELKSNLLAPVRSGTVKARGEVLRAGRILTVCQGDAFGVVEDEGDPRRDDARDDGHAQRGPCGSHAARLMSKGRANLRPCPDELERRLPERLRADAERPRPPPFDVPRLDRVEAIGRWVGARDEGSDSMVRTILGLACIVLAFVGEIVDEAAVGRRAGGKP
jgi:hypothetical protein